MENNQPPSRKKGKCISEQKSSRKTEEIRAGASPSQATKQLLLEICPNNSSTFTSSQRVLVSIKPRPLAIKTLFIAEKSKFYSRKSSNKSGSRYAIGDHSSFTTRCSELNAGIVGDARGPDDHKVDKQQGSNKHITNTTTDQLEQSECENPDGSVQSNILSSNDEFDCEKCYAYIQDQLTMNLPEFYAKTEKKYANSKKIDISTFVTTNKLPEYPGPAPSVINNLTKRLDHLERRVYKQEMVFRSIGTNLSISDEDSDDPMMRSDSGMHPGCSYIQQYSHIPETSAFQRHAHQAAPLSPSKATTIEKEHNSEQYGRDFTTYDGITARGRRQCASVPCKRDDIAAERVHKIRHKLNPVRDYRLMDTVHYLAQGEFAPRDDGIKLTPSREAVLSDIIWEDVCRTHWPNARLGRRGQHAERCSARYELQRLIDSLLRERVAHVERRRRRHYRIVKLNHRHESCRPLGKTGDIIVASHKHRQNDEITNSEHNQHNIDSGALAEKYRDDPRPRKIPKSHDRFLPETSQSRRYGDEDMPGPSYVTRASANNHSTCCYHTSSPAKLARNQPNRNQSKELKILTSTSNNSTTKSVTKNPRLVVKKDPSRKKYRSIEEPNLEHYILLPTLVVRTPSNMKRQKKFNELYHRILNFNFQNADNCPVISEAVERRPTENVEKKDIGFNINITLSDNFEHQ